MRDRQNILLMDKVGVSKTMQMVGIIVMYKGITPIFIGTCLYSVSSSYSCTTIANPVIIVERHVQ